MVVYHQVGDHREYAKLVWLKASLTRNLTSWEFGQGSSSADLDLMVGSYALQINTRGVEPFCVGPDTLVLKI